jgi:hypothetical protein
MADHEQIVRGLLREPREGAKVDFKTALDPRAKRDLAELAKLVMAFANSDDPDLDDYAYVVIGADRSGPVGGAEWARDDGLASEVTRALNRYSDPPVSTEIRAFEVEGGRWIGAVIVKPSARTLRPHVVAKEFSDSRGTVFRRGECWVRHGEVTELALRADLERIYQGRMSLELDAARTREVHRPEPTLVWSQERGERDGEVVIVPPGHFEEDASYEQVIRAGSWLYLRIGNEGTAVLREATAVARFPPHVRVYSRDDIEEMLPLAPGPLDPFLPPVLARITSPEPSARGLFVDESAVDGDVKRLQHGFTIRFKRPCFVVPGLDEQEITVEWEVHAENLPQPKRGTLKILVRSGSARALLDDDPSYGYTP